MMLLLLPNAQDDVLGVREREITPGRDVFLPAVFSSCYLSASVSDSLFFMLLLLLFDNQDEDVCVPEKSYHM